MAQAGLAGGARAAVQEAGRALLRDAASTTTLALTDLPGLRKAPQPALRVRASG